MYFVVSLLVAVAIHSAWGSPITFPGEVNMDNNRGGTVMLPGVSSRPAPKSLEGKPVSAMLETLGGTKETETFRLLLPSDDIHRAGNNIATIGGEILEGTQSNDTSVPSIVHNEISGQGGGDHRGNKQSNETSLLSVLGNDIPEVLNTGAGNNASEGKGSEIPSKDIENGTEADEYYYYDYYDNEDNYYVSTDIPSVNEPMGKSMNEPMDKSMKRMGKSLNFNSDLPSHLPSEGGASMIYFGDEIRRPKNSNTMIMFPTAAPVHSNPTAGTGRTPNSPVFNNPCGRDNEILYQGDCYLVLSSGPCGEGNWLVMNDYREAQCERRLCPMGQILYENRCVDPEDSSICASGQMLYVELTGIAFCDCDSDYFYNIRDGTCIPEYEQGWCSWGKYLVGNKEGTPECVTNPCGISGSVYHEKNRMCYRKNYVGHCKQHDIEIKGNIAECQEMLLATRNIFEVPTLRRCPRGSKRDLLHECRRRFNMPSIPSVLKAKSLYGGCPHGWTKAHRGKCKKIVNLFSGRR